MQNNTRQDTTRHDKTNQSTMRQDKTTQYSTRQDNETQYNTRQSKAISEKVGHVKTMQANAIQQVPG